MGLDPSFLSDLYYTALVELRCSILLCLTRTVCDTRQTKTNERRGEEKEEEEPVQEEGKVQEEEEGEEEKKHGIEYTTRVHEIISSLEQQLAARHDGF